MKILRPSRRAYGAPRDEVDFTAPSVDAIHDAPRPEEPAQRASRWTHDLPAAPKPRGQNLAVAPTRCFPNQISAARNLIPRLSPHLYRQRPPDFVPNM